MATIWISPDYLTKRTVIDSNVEFTKLEPVIYLVQIKYVKRKLGKSLFDAMEAHILANINSATPIPAAYKTLLDDFIFEMMVYYILCESSPTFKYRYTNKGIQVKNSENSQSADLSEIEFLMETWKSNAEVFADDLERYIRNNYTLYPEFFTNNLNEITPELDSYDTDIYLGPSYKAQIIKSVNGQNIIL